MSLLRPVLLLFVGLALIRVPLVGGEPVCCIHLILHDVKKCILISSNAEYFCHFQTAWWLAAFHASTMLFWRHNCYHSLVTYICTSEKSSFGF